MKHIRTFRVGKSLTSESGLTLLELLISIAVLAIVAAIAIPSVSNVLGKTELRALEQNNVSVDEFVERFTEGGTFLYSQNGNTVNGIEVPERTFLGMIDLDGDGELESNEVIAELTIDARFTAVDINGDRIVNVAPANARYPTSPSGITAEHVNVIKE